jgi:hypothetical protein
MKSAYLLAGAALAAVLAPASANAAVVFTTDAAHYEGLGDSIGSAFDQIDLSSVTNTFTGYGTYLINNVKFTVGVNAATGGYSEAGTLANTGSSTLGAFAYSIPYLISIDSSDTITLGGNTVVWNGFNIKFNELTLSSGSEPVFGDLTATVTGVPEAASWALMLAGFGLVGGAMRRRRQSAQVTFA